MRSESASELGDGSVLGVSDEALAQAATRGDHRAFHALYVRHRDEVASSVARTIGSGPDREDVVQEVFLQLHRALPRFRSDARLSTFLRRITMNVAIDHVRRRCRRPCIDRDSAALETVLDTRQDPEQRSSARQQLRSLLVQLDGIARDQRRAFLLVAVAGLSLSAAATRMGTDPDRVKQCVARARRKLGSRAARAPAVSR
jgi:RNA polymerase sigma-70 factor, ECF subfamily